MESKRENVQLNRSLEALKRTIHYWSEADIAAEMERVQRTAAALENSGSSLEPVAEYYCAALLLFQAEVERRRVLPCGVAL